MDGPQEGGGGEMDREIGVDRCTLLMLRIKQVTENPLCSRGSSTQGSVATKGIYVFKQRILQYSRN